MYYKGCRENLKRWGDEKEAEEYTDTLNRIFEEVIGDFLEDEDMCEYYQHVMLEDLKEIETTFNVLKMDGVLPEDIEYLICEEGLYLSGRVKQVYDDEPRREYFVEWRPKHFIV
jgi:hypothetical protein